MKNIPKKRKIKLRNLKIQNRVLMINVSMKLKNLVLLFFKIVCVKT